MKDPLTVWHFEFPLQGGGAGEQAHGQPDSQQQPVHPGRAREQLLSTAHCEDTPAAAALGTGCNCTKAAVTPLQLLHNLLWHERKTGIVCGMDTEAL